MVMFLGTEVFKKWRAHHTPRDARLLAKEVIGSPEQVIKTGICFLAGDHI
jgi:hypothetical protein